MKTTIDKTLFLKELKRCLAIAKDDDHRYYCNAVYLTESGRFIASDGYRLYESALLFPSGNGKMYAAKQLRAIYKIVREQWQTFVEIEITEEEFKVNDLVVDIIAGNYPPYECAKPAQINAEHEWDRDELLRVIPILLSCADKNHIGIFEGNTIQTSQGNVTCTATIFDTPMPFESATCYDLALLKDILNTMPKGCKIKCSFDKQVRPVQLNAGDSGTWLLVPTRY